MFFRRFCLGKCALGSAMLFAVALGSGAARAAEKEDRRPDSPAFNTDATLIVYVDQVKAAGAMAPTTTEIWTIFSNGQGKRRLTSGHKDTNPHFGPDGKHIVFERDGDGDIWMMNTGGDEVHNITNTPDVFERGAQFSNDGDSLFLLAATTIHYTKQQLDANPMLEMVEGSKKESTIQLTLKDGTRRELLSADYEVKTVFADPDDDKVALVLCAPLGADGKPVFLGDKTLVAVPLDGSAPHVVFTTPKGYRIGIAKSAGEHIVLSVTTPEEFKMEVCLLKKAGANTATLADLKTLEKLHFLGDLSCDGTTILCATTGYHAESGFYHGIAIYDIAADKLSPVIEE